MTKLSLVFFWVAWLLNVLLTLYGYREFMQQMFGRYASPSAQVVKRWSSLLGIAAAVIVGSLYLKNQGLYSTALGVVCLPLVPALLYAAWLALILISGPKNWR